MENGVPQRPALKNKVPDVDSNRESLPFAGEGDDAVLGEELAEVVDLHVQGAHGGLHFPQASATTIQGPRAAVRTAMENVKLFDDHSSSGPFSDSDTASS